MRCLLASTSGGWQSLHGGDAVDEAAKAAQSRARQALEQHVVDILLSERLVVLCGLGASRSILSESGNPVAPTMADLWRAAKAKTGGAFAAVMAKVNYAPEAGKENIESLLSHCQMAERLRPDAVVSGFIREAERVIATSCRFVQDATNLELHESFLRKVARRSTRLPRARVFTTNYDLCFETAANRIRLLVVDGFSHTHPQRLDGMNFDYDFVRRPSDRESVEYVPGVFHLLKLHGSVDWEEREGHVIRNQAADRPLLIYPRESKFESSYQQPFLEMMSRFQSSLRQPNTGLLLVGFGMRDAHVTEPILAALRSNVALKMLVVDPALADDAQVEANPAFKGLVGLVSGGDWRLGLLGAGFGQFVPLIPDLAAASEEERHLERLKALLERT